MPITESFQVQNGCLVAGWNGSVYRRSGICPPGQHHIVLSSTAPVSGTKIHGAAFTHWSTRFGLIESLAVAIELKGRYSPLFDTFSRFEGVHG